MIERWGRKRFAIGWTMTLVVALIAVLPPVAAVLQSVRASQAEEWSSGPYRYVIETYGGSLLFSLRLAAFVVFASLLIAVPAAYGFVRYPFPGSSTLEQLVAIPLALPGVSVAIAVIVGYASLRGNWLLLAAGQMLYTVPYAVRVVANTMRNVPLRALEDVARTLGAHGRSRFRHVIAPLLVRPMVLASLIVFALSWGEFNVSFLLATPTQMPFAAALYGTYTSNSAAVSGAATAIFLTGALPLLMALQMLERRPFDFGQGA
ncbi:MAG TPA: ABC transporter permease subunit [Thermoanaerobaculia bacterium]